MDNSVTKEMTISQVLNMHRGTARIFMEFGMTCLGCPHATAESLEDACMAHGAINLPIVGSAIFRQKVWPVKESQIMHRDHRWHGGIQGRNKICTMDQI